MEKKVLLVSLYPNKKSSNCDNIPLSQVIEEFKSGKYATVINEARKYLEEGNKEAYDKIKSELPANTFSATFEGKRLLENLTHYNNLMVMDYDKLDRRRLREIKRLIMKDKHVHFVFDSPSGLGLKVGLLHNGGQKNHKVAFNQINAYLNTIINEEVDQSGKDPNRLTFVSYDPDLYYNEDSVVFEVEATKVSTPKRRGRMDELASEFTIDNSDAIHILKTGLAYVVKHNKSITYDYENWMRLAFIIASLGLSDEDGLEWFIEFSKLDADKFDEEACIKQYEIAFRTNDGSLTIGTLIHLLQEQGYEYRKSPVQSNPDEFWIPSKNKSGSNVEIDLVSYTRFLEKKGFRILPMGKGYTLVKATDNILEEINSFQVKNVLMSHVQNLPEKLSDGITRDDLIREIMRKKTLFMKDHFEFLGNDIGRLHRDNSEATHFYFRNGFVKVTKEGITLHPYSELEARIWKRQIIDREFQLLEPAQDCFFNKFIQNVTGDDQNRFFSLVSLIGYLLSTHKDSVNAKVAIFVDEQISSNGEANGGTGKTLIAKAISKLRNMIIIDGKNFTWNRFAFQQVSLDTDLVLFDDIKRDFDFEYLYSTTTTGIDVEKKSEHRFNIPFEDAPKIMINTNFTVRGTGGHTEARRKFTVEISDYYGPNLSPDKEFGHRFFDDWDAEEWNKFDNFMINAAQTFLQHGLVACDFVNLAQREIVGRTCPEFIDYMEAGEFKIGKDERCDILYEDFKEEFPDFKRWLTVRTFQGWVRLYIQHKNWVTYEYQRTKGKEYFHKRNGHQYFRLVE